MASGSSLVSPLLSYMAVTSPMFQSQGLNLNKLLSTTCKRGTTMSISLQPANKPVSHHERTENKRRRVVVTGLGLVTAIGHDPDVFYNNALQGISGITKVEEFDTSGFPSSIGGEIKSFSSEGYISTKLALRADKYMHYLLTAGKKALADGAISDEVNRELDKTRCGIVIGSGLGGLRIFYEWFENMLILSKRPNPFTVPMSANNMGSAILAMDLGWMGPNYVINAGCSTSNHCILSAAGHIASGETDMMLCGGSDAGIHRIGVAGLASCRIMSTKRDSEPTKALRPWDADRDGTVGGDGAGVLLLEELEHAKQRGARIYAEFLGGSMTSDAYHMTQPHPDGDGIALCIENALANAGIAREDVNYINAHAASTRIGDMTEFRAFMRCFGNNPQLRINSTKPMTGHLMGATSAVEAIASVKAIQTGWVHPNINLDNPEKGVDMNFLVGPKKEQLDVKVALSTSFTFGGQNSAILFAPLQCE